MKKRILALLLAALLLLSLAPFAVAEDDTEEPPIYVEYCYVMLINQLTRGNHDLEETRTTLGYGDTVEVNYQGNVAADVYLNGAAVHHFNALEEGQTYTKTIDSMDPITIVVRTEDGKELYNRSFTILSSKDMYRETLKEAVDVRIMIESLKYGSMHGFPVGNPFVYPFLIGGQIVYFFRVLFSFPRIIK